MSTCLASAMYPSAGKNRTSPGRLCPTSPIWRKRWAVPSSTSPWARSGTPIFRCLRKIECGYYQFPIPFPSVPRPPSPCGKAGGRRNGGETASALYHKDKIGKKTKQETTVRSFLLRFSLERKNSAGVIQASISDSVPYSQSTPPQEPRKRLGCRLHRQHTRSLRIQRAVGSLDEKRILRFLKCVDYTAFSFTFAST